MEGERPCRKQISIPHFKDVRLCNRFDLFIMASSLGVPVKLLHESLGHTITVELKTGQLYRGRLAEGV